DMKGQGGTFGYKLMTTVLDYLCTYLERQEVMSNDGLDVIQLHIEAAKTIINNRLTEDGGETGDQILLGLQKMINKKG
ncbi:MAG: phosphorelay protein, partial [Rhodospirillales bacterium]|nr:phosphorelay protein [Rhodospirillales bacterium]